MAMPMMPLHFFYFDEKLRTILVQFLMRFEIQVKSDFAAIVEKETRSKKFWCVSKYYLAGLRAKRPGKRSNFYLTKKNIQNYIGRMSFKTIGPLNYAAMYSISFGCFKTLFRHIDLKYKQPFIDKYSSHLNVKSFDLLYAYFDCIRLLRNRCAHGNHIITMKFKNELNCHKKIVTNPKFNPIGNGYISVFEAVLFFLIKQLNCGDEFKNKLKKLFMQNNYLQLLSKYKGRHSLSPDVVKKIF